MQLRILILLIFSFLAIQSEAQLTLGNDGIDGIIGYEYQNAHTIELGIAKGTRGTDLAGLFYGNIHLCGEILFNNKANNIYGLKAGVTGVLAFLNAAGQMIYFTNFDGNSSIVLRPELGLSFIGLVDLSIGRNIVIGRSDPLNLNATVFIVRITLGQTSRNMFRRRP